MSDYKKFLLCAALYYYLGEVFYIDIGQPAAAKYFLPPIPITIAFLWLIQYSYGEKLFSRAHLPNLLTGLAWCISFPLFYTWTYQRQWFMSLIYYDFAVGTAIFIFLAGLTVILRKYSSIICAFNLFFLLIPLIELIYYCLTWHCLSPASLMAIYLTNWHEAGEFLISMIGIPKLIILLAAIVFILRYFYGIHRKFGSGVILDKKKLIAAIISVIWSLFALIYYVPQTSMAGLWKNVSDYAAQTQLYNQNREEKLADLKISTDNRLNGTIILVIGESASRNYMHAYKSDYEFENTPWMEEMLIKSQSESGKFILFRNAYASWTQTVPVLQRALTEQSQYNDKAFYESISIIDVAKKAGFKTYWFSNQGRYGEYDSAITLVAKTADISEWTDDSFDFSELEDEILLRFLDKVDSDKKNFIVFHLMGSHIYYSSRYPHKFKKWVTADGLGMMTSEASYANTILYTDYVLSRIFDYAKAKLNLEVMIYFSDHGEDLEISHNPDVFRFEMLRIPMFIYFSTEYEKNFPDRVSTLEKNREKYFTNDLIYDTICGMINAKSNRYDSGQDFSSEEYKFTRETLTTMLGQHKLTEDKE